MAELRVIQEHLVLVRLPREKGMPDKWITVDKVVASDQEQAIREAVKKHGAEILNYVDAAAVAFISVPTREVPVRSTVMIDTWVSGHGDLQDIDLSAGL